MAELTKHERKELLRSIKKASGVSQYALDAKMTDEQLIVAAQHLDILALIKDANNYNRRRQGMKTEKVNTELTLTHEGLNATQNELATTKYELTETKTKLQELLNIENSEILKAGRWLMDALSRTGSDRKQTLLEKELVHKEDYNETVSGMRDTLETINVTSEQITKDAETTISSLERQIDILRNQMSRVQEYVSNNYGADKWRAIKDTFKL
jgi:hypothetical protein